MDRIRNAVRKGRQVEAGLNEVINEVLDRHVALGTINDAAWAESRAKILTRKGIASRVIGQRLRQHGIEEVAPALAAVREAVRDTLCEGEHDVNPDLVAACAWARRKHVGPYARESEPEPEAIGLGRAALRERQDEERAAEKRTLGAMARAGYSFDICRKVLAMDRDDADGLLRRMG